MDQGFLNLSWDAPDAKLEEAPTLAGPWQTVIATGSPYRLRPSASITNRCRFYRLKMPAPGKKWLTVAAVTMTSQTNTEANLQTLFSFMERASSNHVDLIVFPEVALQGCPAWAQFAHPHGAGNGLREANRGNDPGGRAPAISWQRQRS